jgi:hypothetical protein
VSLLRPGELLTLRVADAGVFDVVLSALREDDERAACATSARSPGSIVPSRVLDSLQAVGWSERGNSSDGALTIVKQCAGTLKELDCRFEEKNDEWNEALPSCTRLEILTSAATFPPAAWLGLSQLHTLLGVDLTAVSVAAIAAALPRLRTLDITTYFRPRPTAASVAGFFETLLPRLRVFRFRGSQWPGDDGTPRPVPPPVPLPLLEELVWESIHLFDGFDGAQPVVLWAPRRAIATLMAASRGDGSGPLSHVRDVRFYGDASRVSDIAAVVRAAPELRLFHAGVVQKPLEWHSNPAFAGLVHRKLRLLHIKPHPDHLTEDELQFPAEGVALQAHHFPRLRALELVRKL